MCICVQRMRSQGLLCLLATAFLRQSTTEAFTNQWSELDGVKCRPATASMATHSFPNTRRRRDVSVRLVGRTETSETNENVEEVDRRIRDKEFMERTKHWVILVDDEEAIRLAVGDYLYDQGYQITACADADAMLEMCAKPQKNGELPTVPDVIVSDVRMPGKDGLELLGLIRADERLERVPVVLLTAKGMTQDRIEGYKAGADVYLPKPFNPEELLSIIDNVILRRKQMTGDKAQLVDLKAEMSNIKQLLRKNGSTVVKVTDVYLTPAEREVLELLCKGYTNGEIAEERGVSVIGVNRMIQKLYLTTQTRTRTELVRWAIETGYVSRKR